MRVRHVNALGLALAGLLPHVSFGGGNAPETPPRLRGGAKDGRYGRANRVPEDTYRRAEVEFPRNRKAYRRGSYLWPEAKNPWANLWNGEARNINDLIDDYEYGGDDGVFDEIVKRSREVLRRALIPQFDEVRQKTMLGLGEPRKAYYGLNYFWHFHSAGGLQPIARFVDLLRRNESSPGLQEEFHRTMVRILEMYFGEWDQEERTYRCPMEEHHWKVTRKEKRRRILPHNMAATIGITYLYLSSMGGNRADLLRRRATMMAEVLRDDLHLRSGRGGQPYVVWHYVADDARMEDADHALADLEFVLLMNERGLVFSDETTQMMLTTWFHQGLNDDLGLTHRIDGSDPSTRTPLADVVARCLHVLRRDKALFRKFTGME